MRVALVLTEAERDAVADCARRMAARYSSGEVRERAYVPGNDRLANAFIGCGGEAAFARWRGVPWKCDLTLFGRPDVDGYHVRTRRADSPRPHLGIQPQDSPGIYVLVHADGPEFIVMGWIERDRALAVGYVADPGGIGRPATFVSPQLLEPIETLPEVRG